MNNFSKIKKHTIIFGAFVLSGCANLPPIMQDHDGTYGLYLPTNQQLMSAMLYQQDAKFTVANGKTCILEHNTLNGHVRFLYPDDTFNQMHGWRDVKYVYSETLPDGQVLGIFIVDINGQITEELVIFHPHGISYVPLGTNGIAYAVRRVTENHILFQQVNVGNPMLRLYTIPQGTLSRAVLQSTLTAQENAEREQKMQKARAEQEKQEREKERRERMIERQREEAVRPQRVFVPQRAVTPIQSEPKRQEHMDVQIISIQGGAIPVQSSVPAGHQNVRPQTVNLQ
ncbi:hypothetical protein [Acidithiobacillus concretivorus]|uniref:Lipoprotein n=1 Tax=Acidithiobacillus concretivorus TaxID=3063952 RepID=A0ABS5ZM30_9PROT|nr:hypothetical protein [Acidithiobacillus concretivorus]MBU2737710.1 hypothetical protein [Acidithiobacillus concretivorus]